MAEVVVLGNAPSRAMYEEVGKVLDVGLPAGMIVHTATELADGSVRIVDVWESEAAVEAFDSGVLGPAIERVMAELPSSAHPAPPPPPERLVPFAVMRG